MANHDTLEFLRAQLIKDISHLLCRPCTDARKSKFIMNYENPVLCPCRCETVEPLIARLIEVEKAMDLSAKHLT